jgi:hypothetical protein
LFGKQFGALDDTDVAWILSDEALYGDGPPRWPKAPWSQDAIDKRAAASERLRRFNKKNPRAASVATILEKCWPALRCMSNGCPECCRGFQRWWISTIKKLIQRVIAGASVKHGGAAFEIIGLNWVMPDGQAPLGSLGGVDVETLLGKCREALIASGVVVFAALAVDTSVNDLPKNHPLGPAIWWQVHINGLLCVTDRKKVAAALRKAFPKAANIYRPVHIPKKYDGSNRAISYSFKPDAFRRVTFWNEWGQRPCWNTKRPAPRLKAHEQVEFLVAMHTLGFAKRILLFGLHPVFTANTKKRKRGVALRRVAHRTSREAVM